MGRRIEDETYAPSQRKEARPPERLCVFEAASWRCAGRRTLLGGLQGTGREKLALIETWSKGPRQAVARGIGRLKPSKPKRTRG